VKRQYIPEGGVQSNKHVPLVATMGKYAILTFSLFLLVLSSTTYIIHNQAAADLQAQIDAHKLVYVYGTANHISSHGLSANSTYRIIIYLENQAYYVAELEATVNITLSNGTALIQEDVYETMEAEDPEAELQEMATASAEYELVFTTTDPQNIQINITCIYVGDWRVTIYENLPPNVWEINERAQDLLGIAIILFVFNILILIFGLIDIKMDKGKRELLPEEPLITSQKTITSNRVQFNQLFSQLLFSRGEVQLNQEQGFRLVMDRIFERYEHFFKRLKELGIEYELHPRNGLTTFLDPSVPEGSEQWQYHSLVRMAHDVNRAHRLNAWWIIIVFLMGIYVYCEIVLIFPTILIGMEAGYLFLGVLAGCTTFLLIMACKVLGGGNSWGYAHTLLLLDQSMVKHLWERGIFFPFADLRRNRHL
jgi:hypothetical protein